MQVVPSLRAIFHRIEYITDAPPDMHWFVEAGLTLIDERPPLEWDALVMFIHGEDAYSLQQALSSEDIVSPSSSFCVPEIYLPRNFCQGAAMVLSSSETDSWDSPGGTIVIINSTFEGGLARGSAGAVAALGKFSTLNITGNSSR